MGWDQGAFDDALKNKYKIMQQGADADTTRAGAAAQDVAQRPGLQAAADNAAMRRAQLGADTQMDLGRMAGKDRAGLAAGANALEQARLAQQGQQANAALGLDWAKARESSITDRARLSLPEFGAPDEDNPGGWTKRPGLDALALPRSPLADFQSARKGLYRP